MSATKTDEKAAETLLEYLNKIEKNFEQKKLVLSHLIELNKIQKDNLDHIYVAKIVKLDSYKKILYDYEVSCKLISDYRTEVESIAQKIKNLRTRIKVTFTQPESQHLGKLYRFRKAQ